MAILEENTIVLAEVEKLTHDASTNASLIIEENNDIKRLDYHTYVLNPISKNTNAIGWPDDIALDSSNTIYSQIQDIAASIDQINENIGNDSTEDTIKYDIKKLKEFMVEEKTKKPLEGYRAKFIDREAGLNLLSDSPKYECSFNNFNGHKLIECIRKYTVNIHFDISYELERIGIIHTSAELNLNTITNNSTEVKKFALLLPYANAVIILQTSISGNNLTITRDGSPKDADSLKSNTGVFIDYGELEIKFVEIISGDTEGGETGGDSGGTIPVVETPLTLCFNPEDLWLRGTTGYNKDPSATNKIMYGTKIKFDIGDLGENYSGVYFKTKMGNNEPNRYPDEDGTPKLQYIYGGVGNKLTVEGNTDSSPAIIQYDEKYSELGIQPGTWFKYYTNNGTLSGGVIELHFNNYKYFDGVSGHEIKFIPSGNALNVDNLSCKYAESFCFPFSQWQAFTAEPAATQTYEFNLICNMGQSAEEKRITKYTVDNTENPKIITLKTANDEPLIKAVDYGGIENVRPAIYVKSDVEYFSISIIQREVPSAGDGGTQPSA